jgi:hypothetical protein
MVGTPARAAQVAFTYLEWGAGFLLSSRPPQAEFSRGGDMPNALTS